MSTSGNGRTLSLFLAFLLLVGAVAVALGPGTNSASGDEASGPSGLTGPTAVQTKEALESGNAQPILDEPETDLHAAQTMPHSNLQRNQALELAEAVFQPEIENAGGIYDELEAEKFLGENAAIVPASSMPEGSGPSKGSLPSAHPNMPILIESILPLRTENSSGEMEAVDLGLEHSEGQLQPKNPLAEVGIPEQLGEGISMGGSEVEITVPAAAERGASVPDGEFAFYPETSRDSDLIITPTPQGVEAMVDLRSPDAPMETTYGLELPSAALLRPDEQGGAEVVNGVETTLVIPAPTAVDAAGNPVDTELAVAEHSLTVIARPTPSTAYPVLVDPTFIEEGWFAGTNGRNAWLPQTTNPNALEPFRFYVAENAYEGLDLSSGVTGGTSHYGDYANWLYQVPRYAQDVTTGTGEPPSTWIYQLYVEGPQFEGYGNLEPYPALIIGLYDTSKGWQGNYGIHFGSSGDLTDRSHPYWYTNPTEQTGTKMAIMNLVTYVEERPAKRRDTYMPDAYVEVVDTDAPEVLSLNPPTGWNRNTFTIPSYEVQDRGLGIERVEATFEGKWVGATGPKFGCSGQVMSPCPRTMNQVSSPLPQMSTNVPGASLPTGLDWITLKASDPIGIVGDAGHTGTAKVLVKVDQSGPEVALSGALVEQGSLGTRRPTYPLRVTAKDGVSGAPQSGVKKVEVKVDGAPVSMPEPAEWEPNCATENCSLSAEWTLKSSEYAAGPHEVQVIATDALGNTTTKTVRIELRHPAPALTVSGSLTEQSSIGTELPSYKLQVNASALTESPPAAGLPSYASSFGTSGTGSGQFAHPGDVALGYEGNLFVVDTNNNRVEKFTATGSFVSAFGTKGSGNGQLNRPTAIVVAANGNLWVTDSLNRRVEEFTPAGAYVAKFGTAGAGAGQFAGSGPEGIAIDYHGNIWVSDTYGGRIEKFGEEGKFIRSVGIKGTAYEQLGQPTALDVAPGGQIYVTDWEDDKIAEYGEGGAFIRQFGSEGSEAGQLRQPTGIAVDSRGDIWVGDQNNQRVEEFNQAGEYLGRFGASGSGAGQFSLQYPIGIATDTRGDIWVTDPLDNRVEKWVSSGYAVATGPTFLRTIGGSGTGKGQFNWPTGLAVDAKNNIWITDLINNRLQKFNEKGEWQAEFGSGGTANGLFNHPLAVAIDPKGHLWVTDTENNRVQEFSETGGWMRTIGTTTKGTGAGQFNWPAGIAVDAKNHVWVADTQNNRLQEFSETGAWMRTVGGAGSGAGQMAEPYGLAVSPAGNVWVADTGNKRLDEFSETGSFIRSVGGSGSGVGQFNTATDVEIDSAGNLWVMDQNNARVEEFSSTGEEFLSAFGEPGSGSGALLRPLSVALDHTGHIFAADYERNLVTEWTRPAANSQISTEITVDGKRVDAGEGACATESCALTRSWTLQSSNFTPGSHVVTIRATDGLGNTTTKTLNVKVGDTTKPGLEVGGELFSAPEGWVQQEHGNYGFHANATDTGFGVTALTLKIDGKVVASKEQSCPAGKCSAAVSTVVNVATLAAGAHKAEVRAADGAGNTTSKEWTINVDPKGAISTSELVATAEALEETGGAAIAERPILTASEEEIPSTLEPPHAGQIVAGETNVPIAISQNPSEGTQYEVAGRLVLEPPCSELVAYPVTEGGEPVGSTEEQPLSKCAEVKNPLTEAELKSRIRREEEEVASGTKSVGLQPITVAPKNTAEGASSMTPVNGEAAVAANTGNNANTVFRPISDGGYSFGILTSPEAAEHYAFELDLSPLLELVQTSPQVVSVQYVNNGPIAFTITALPAHDAIGSSVPTHIAVTGLDVVTLTIEHRGASPAGGSFVYPVTGGTGWEGGYYAVAFEMNEPPPSSSEEGEEEWELEQLEDGNVTVAAETIGPPEEYEPLTVQEKRVLEINPADPTVKLRKKFEFNVCRPRKGQATPINVEGTREEKRDSAAQNLHFHCFDPSYEGNYWRESVSGRFHMVFEKQVWLNWKEWGCHEGGDPKEQPLLEHCEAFYPNGAHYVSGTRFKGPVDPMAQWRFGIEQGHWAADFVVKCMQMGGQLFPNPRQNLHPYEEPLIYQRPSKVQSGEPCHAYAP